MGIGPSPSKTRESETDFIIRVSMHNTRHGSCCKLAIQGLLQAFMAPVPRMRPHLITNDLFFKAICHTFRQDAKAAGMP
tara:strand:- start:211 stop:447 length:237 start_codon:yes stop_codon:yes gene_type:complete